MRSGICMGARAAISDLLAHLVEPLRNRALQREPGSQPEAGSGEEPQKDLLVPGHLRMQRYDSHLAHDLGELLHEALTNAALLSVGFHTDCVEHGGGVLMTELAAQDAGDGKAAQGAAPHHADLDEVVRAEFRRRHALLEEMPPGMADVG